MMDKEAHSENMYVLDPESPVEMARLIDLDRVVTKAMGGTLVGVANLPEEAKVLDLACGPGGWALDVAFEHPEVEVAGVDISKTMIDYAYARAHTQHLTNVSFGVMDITQPLDFSDETFDLVNARLLAGVLRRESWQSFLTECTRILKPGGILRLTEPVDVIGITSSAAYERLVDLTHQALWRLGYGFSVDGRTLGATTTLPWLLRKMGYRNVHNLARTLEFSSDCQEAWQDMYRNLQAASYLAPKFYLKAGVIAQEEIEPLYQRAFMEMLAEDFRGMWHFVTVLGIKP
ncbi:MAG TPA: methyltransferase domain-containing protein [Ktedonobacteraceae bacterium]|nr:methyltransferase domain-containing protein [Ktedonobacteraceae bacterium]